MESFELRNDMSEHPCFAGSRRSSEEYISAAGASFHDCQLLRREAFCSHGCKEMIGGCQAVCTSIVWREASINLERNVLIDRLNVAQSRWVVKARGRVRSKLNVG